MPEARSFCSTSRTLSPRPAASRAMPTPLMPPPMMARSKSAMLPLLIRRCSAAWGRRRSRLKRMAAPCDRRLKCRPVARAARLNKTRELPHVISGSSRGGDRRDRRARHRGGRRPARGGRHLSRPLHRGGEAERFPHRDHARVGADRRRRPHRRERRSPASLRACRSCGPRSTSPAASPTAPIGDTTAPTCASQIDMNFVTCFLCCRAAVRRHARGNATAGASSTWRPARRSKGAPAPT